MVGLARGISLIVFGFRNDASSGCMSTFWLAPPVSKRTYVGVAMSLQSSPLLLAAFGMRFFMENCNPGSVPTWRARSVSWLSEIPIAIHANRRIFRALVYA